jgi:AAA domain
MTSHYLNVPHLEDLPPVTQTNGSEQHGRLTVRSSTGSRLVWASSISIKKPRWAWEHRIPIAGVTLLAGREGMGKTALVGHLAARLTRGDLAGDFFGRPADVVYVGNEDDQASVLVPRLHAAGADVSRVAFFDAPDDLFSIDEGVGELEELLSYIQPALVVIDPLDSHLGATVDSHRKGEVQRAISRLATLAQTHDCGVVGLAHLNKGESRDLLTRVVGSVGFTTAVRSVIGVGEHPANEQDRVAVLAKSNLTDRGTVPALRFRLERREVEDPTVGSIDTVGVAILGEELGIDPHAIVSALGADERSERDDAADWLLELLADGPMLYKEIERLSHAENISRATLHRARHRAGVEVSRDDTAKGRPSTWSPPSHAVSSPPQPHPPETKSNRCDVRPSGPSEGVSSHVPGVGNETANEHAGDTTSCQRCGITDATPTIFGQLCDACSDLAAHGRDLPAPKRGWPDELEEDMTS